MVGAGAVRVELGSWRWRPCGDPGLLPSLKKTGEGRGGQQIIGDMRFGWGWAGGSGYATQVVMQPRPAVRLVDAPLCSPYSCLSAALPPAAPLSLPLLVVVCFTVV